MASVPGMALLWFLISGWTGLILSRHAFDPEHSSNVFDDIISTSSMIVFALSDLLFVIIATFRYGLILRIYNVHAWNWPNVLLNKIQDGF